MTSNLQGQSGCPVVSGRGIVGIHIGSGKSDENFNLGRLITLDMIKKLESWRK
jgi:hypothetical protein